MQSGAKSPEQIALVASLIAKTYFYCWVYPVVAPLWARDVLFPFCEEELNHGIASLQLCRKYEAKGLFHLRAPETLSPWTSLPIQMWMCSFIPISLLSPSPTKDETYSSTQKNMRKNGYRFLEWLSTCAGSTSLTVQCSLCLVHSGKHSVFPFLCALPFSIKQYCR